MFFLYQDEPVGLTCSRRRCEDTRSLSVLQDILRQSADQDLSRPSAAIIKLDTAESQVHKTGLLARQPTRTLADLAAADSQVNFNRFLDSPLVSRPLGGTRLKIK